MREKNAIGRPFWLRVAESATSEASVSTARISWSLGQESDDLAMSVFSAEKDDTASGDNGNDGS